MKRGLKRRGGGGRGFGHGCQKMCPDEEGIETPGYIRSCTPQHGVRRCAPMKRGLKLLSLHFALCLSNIVRRWAPMKRGLKRVEGQASAGQSQTAKDEP